MDRTLHIVGRNSSEIFMLRYPRSLLNFCDYDLTYFAENAIAVCDEALRAGELDFDRVTDLRNSLKGAHICIEHNIRTTYDKIVLDCWIDYICRRDNVGTGSLWSRFMPCNTAFEKAVFTRLCDFRYKRAVNEWLNIVRIQDYAKSKISFIFSPQLNSVGEAAARRNYFDLMFSVTARELGCRNEDLGVVKSFSVGRIPSAPFVYTNISKDIVKNLLSEFDYSDDYSDTGDYGAAADQIAMDAFSYMKSGLSNEYQSYNMTRAEMENAPTKVYMPCGLKAVVDLEIDALIESGGWLARCKRCGRYFVRDNEHMEEYCSHYNQGGKTCLEIYEIENPKSYISPALERACREITDEMYNRVGASLSLHEYESWKVYLDALHDKVENGEIPSDELEAFIGYSRSLDISRSNPVTEVKKPEPQPQRERERVVKPFVPQRIDRSEIEAQRPQPKPVEEYDDYEDTPRGKSFFISPTVQKQRSQEAPMTHIIRGGEEYPSQPRSFTPFGRQEEQVQPDYRQGRPLQPAAQPQQSARPQAQPMQQIYRAGARDEVQSYQPQTFTGADFSAGAFAANDVSRSPEPPQEFDFQRIGEKLKELQKLESKQLAQTEDKPDGFELFGDISYDNTDSMETNGSAFDFDREPVTAFSAQQDEEQQSFAEQSVQEQPKPKVIRKNAAAMSAYGRISGAPLVTAASQEAAVPAFSFSDFGNDTQSKEAAQPIAEPEPFKNIGSIFDVLEQSGSVSGNSADNMDDSYFVFDREPAPAPEPIPEPVSEPVYEAPKQPDPADIEQSFMQQQERFAETTYEPLPEEKPKPKRRSSKPANPSESTWAAESEPRQRVIPEKVTSDNVPGGIWTEERNLFSDEANDAELEMLKEKKRKSSHKTQRLFDAIMKEPEDNPNVRRKK